MSKLGVLGAIVDIDDGPKRALAVLVQRLGGSVVVEFEDMAGLAALGNLIVIPTADGVGLSIEYRPKAANQ